MATIFQDAFVGNAGILIDTPVGTTGRAITVGTGWIHPPALVPGIALSTVAISSGGRAYNVSGSGNGYYFTTPPSAALMLDGDASLDIIMVGGGQPAYDYKGLLFRASSTSGNTYYYSFQYNGNSGQLEFVRYIGTAYTLIQTFPGAVPSPLVGLTTYTLKVQARGSLFAFFVNGIQLAAPAVAGVPTNWVRDTGITQAGNWGLITAGADTDTYGVHADNLLIADVLIITVTAPPSGQLIANVGPQALSLAASSPVGWTPSTVFTVFSSAGLTGATAPTTTGSADPSHIALSVNPGTTVGTLTLQDPNLLTVAISVVSDVALSPITPAAPTILTTATATFSTVVSGHTSGNNAVTWTATAGSITPAGVYTPPSVAGSYTVTATSVFDPSKTVSTTVTVVVPPTAPVATLTSTATTDTANVPAAPLAGTNAITSLSLYPTDALGNVTGTALSTLTPAGYPVSFPAIAAPAAGSFRYYAVRAVDSAGYLSSPSNMVGRGTTLIAPSNPPSTYLRTFTAPYGTGAAGQPLGYTVFDFTLAILAPRTTSGVGELPGSGIYVVRVALDTLWSGVLVWDAPPGGGPYVESFDAALRALAPVASRC